ncbi:hypothetical protein DH2020_049101 [Rehmannia glutinosa]|uniref:Anaphase-promoting complex subunit 4-like WD40 domain-containing protein n=1 Tax=Rehmannia glutinosa TaxID=99300 RepID=A0ABR0U3R9_REHGL
METPSTSTSSIDPKTPASKLLSSTYSRPSSSRTIYSDRFIPSRSSSNFALFNLPNSNSAASSDDSHSAYTNLLKSALFGPECVGGGNGFQPLTPEKSAAGGRFGSRNSDGNVLQISPPNCNIFKYKTETRKSLHSLTPFGYDDQLPGVSHSPVKAPRKVPRSPYKVLDAPALQDDFYLNLVDWSAHNVLAVGLGNCVYLWHASSSKVMVVKLCDLGFDDSVCSVGWAHRGTHLAVGTSNGKLQLWDASRCKRIRTMEGHRLRVGALAWSSSVLSSGSRDKSILQRDIRAQEDYVSKLSGHKSEVCGLKWSYDNRELASGGNDNRLATLTGHTYRVLYLAISPDGQTIVTGAGDETLRFWNVFPSPKSQNTESEIGASSFGRTQIR